MSIAVTVPKPYPVPASLVRDFDCQDFPVPGHDSDVHLAWKRPRTSSGPVNGVLCLPLAW